MAKGRLLIRMEYILARALLALLRLIPVRHASGCGAVFGSLVRRLSPGLRRTARCSLALAYGDTISIQEKRRILRACFRNLGRTLFEFMTWPRLDREGILARVDFENLELMDRALARGRGVLAVTGHIANWELLAAGFAATGRPLAVVVRPLDNPLLDAWVERFRTDKGMAVIPRGAALRGGMRALKAGSVLAFVMDQNAARHGIFVPLFGTEAATVRGPAELALKYGAPIILCHSRREKKGRHRLVFVEEIVPSQARDREEAVRRTTARINAGLEKVIRERPEEWLWFHPRWRTRPPGEPPLY